MGSFHWTNKAKGIIIMAYTSVIKFNDVMSCSSSDMSGISPEAVNGKYNLLPHHNDLICLDMFIQTSC